MNYPLISEYIEAIKSAEDNFEELSYLRPVLGDDGLPVMTGGNFAVVFKMKDEQSGKIYAIKCFTKEQEGRAEAYREIAKELKDVSSPYILSIRYIEKELFVDTDQTTETEFPVLLMDWVEGKTLDKYLRENIEEKEKIEALLTAFFQLAEWLVTQPFAHGDLKPDNILVREDGSLVLVDYDGMFVPAMIGQKSRENGSPDFSHPQRSEEIFDEHIDDFSILSILLSLSIVFVNNNLLAKYGADGRLLFSKNDYENIQESEVFNNIPPIIGKITNYILLFEEACKDLYFHLKEKQLTPINVLIIELIIYSPGTSSLNITTSLYSFNSEDSTTPLRVLFEDDKKPNKSTGWQAALLLHILTIIFILILADEIWSGIGWGFCIGLFAWIFYYCDYVKKDGNTESCLWGCLLAILPIAIYYDFFECIYMLINYLKERRQLL